MKLQKFKNKAENLISQLNDLIQKMPQKDISASECQRVYLQQLINEVGYGINGTKEIDMIDVKFNNHDLKRDIEKIMEFSKHTSVVKSECEDDYVLDIGDNSFFYANEDDRENDYDSLKLIVPQFMFL